MAVQTKCRQQYFLFLSSLLFRFISVECQSVTMGDMGVVSIHEDVYWQKDLCTISCTDLSSLHDNSCRSCNIDRSISTPGPFDVWSTRDGTDFHAYYVGGLSTSDLRYSTYKLYITCVPLDGTDPTTKILEVDVIPNAPPVITNYKWRELVEKKELDAMTTREGEIVYSMFVTDPEHEHLTYTLYTRPRVDYFTVNGTGVIKTAKDLRCAVESVVHVMVNVSDGRNVVGPLTVTVKLKNMNERPIIKNLPMDVTVDETAKGGDLIATLVVDDQYQWPVSYPSAVTTTSMTPRCTVDPASESYKFVFNYISTSSWTIKLKALPNGHTLLDAEFINYYNISCIVNDGFLDSVGQYINLYVTNINEPPVFDQDIYFCQLPESNAFTSSCDLGLTVTDPEYDVITNTFLLPVNYSERFRYYDTTKRLAFTVDYDIDPPTAFPNTVYLTIVAVDDKHATGSATIQVYIYDVNDNAPKFEKSVVSYPIHEGRSLGFLGVIQATDKDLTAPFNTIKYTPIQTLQYGSSSRGAVLNNGRIYYTNEFDRSEHGQSYFIYLKAEDGGTPPKSSTATIQITYQTTTTTTTTTSTTTTTTPKPSTSFASTSTTTVKPYNFFDYPANIGLFSVLMILLSIGVVVGLYFLYQYYVTGFCCGKPSVPGGGNRPSKVKPYDDDDDYYSDRRRPDTSSTMSDFDDRDFKNKRGPSRNRDYFDERSRTPQSVIVKVGEYNRSYRY